MSKISAILVVKDNPIHLAESIQSLDFVDEIVIVDIGINDDAKKILSQYDNVKVQHIKEQILYVEQIREKSKEFATHEHVIFLDPDEIIASALKEEIVKNMNNCDYISIPRKNIIFGKWIEHSRWWPDYQIRFFKKDSLVWPSRLHAQPEVKGKEYKIEAIEEKAIIHYNYETVDEYLSKMIRYAKAEAKEYIHKNSELTLTISFKKGLQEFISRYFAEKGYKDGMHGTVLAFLQMFYCLLVYFFYWEQNKNTVSQNHIQATEITNHFKQTLYESTYWIEKEKLGSQTERIRNKVLNSLLKRM
ncbi:glycosyltransferase family 2 protein [Candidatus Woesebacteria bacterium]|nr:glycosyltransferase family 2 protein [Candidatus Woesebacteria bacterium]